MYMTFIITITIIILFIDWYFYRALKAFVFKSKPKLRKATLIFYWSLTLGTIIFMGIAVSYYLTETAPPKFARTYIMGTVFVIVLSKIVGSILILIDDLYKVTLWTTRKIKKQPTTSSDSKKISRKEFLKRSAVITAFLPFTTMMTGMISTAFNYKVRTAKVKTPGLPKAFNGLRILQISDIHTGSFMDTDPLEKAVELINQQNADVVFFTGDLVNEVAEEALPFIDTLKKIKAPYGVFSILGNHDYGDYFYQPDDVDGKQRNMNLIKKVHSDMNWNLLLNDNARIEKDGEEIVILGVENWGDAGRFQKYGDINQAKKNVPEDSFKLLLSHDPSHWNAQVTKDHPDIAVTFSGHTHGFQFGIEIPGFKWSPSKYIYKQWAGLYSENDQHIYVNRGLGFIGYPGRVGILPEITIVELEA